MMSTVKATRKSPRGEARRNEILDAALRVFAQRGYEGSAISVIAEEAGIAQSGLLHHFSSKEDLLKAVLNRVEDEGVVFATRVRESQSTPLDELRELANYHEANSQTIRLLTRISAGGIEPDHPAHEIIKARYETTRIYLQRILESNIPAGVVPSKINSSNLTRLLIAVLDGIELQWFYNPEIKMGELVDLYLSLLESAAHVEKAAHSLKISTSK